MEPTINANTARTGPESHTKTKEMMTKDKIIKTKNEKKRCNINRKVS